MKNHILLPLLAMACILLSACHIHKNTQKTAGDGSPKKHQMIFAPAFYEQLFYMRDSMALNPDDMHRVVNKIFQHYADADLKNDSMIYIQISCDDAEYLNDASINMKRATYLMAYALKYYGIGHKYFIVHDMGPLYNKKGVLAMQFTSMIF